MDDCPFCSESVLEKQVVYECADTRVLHNIRPAAPGHLLVVPKRHVCAIRHLSLMEHRSLWDTVHLVANHLMTLIEPAPIGLNYGSNEGSWAGQSVEHAHVHVLPRYADDRIPQYHLFHRDPRTKQNLSESDLAPRVEFYKRLFKE